MKKLSDNHRLLLHIPVGLALALAFWAQPLFGAGMTFMFWYYENDECHHIRDQAWKDVAGTCWGMGIAAVIWTLWRAL